jgi:hypothetical protein
LKSRAQVAEILKKQWINFHNYNRIYIYYPGAWRRAGIVALYFDENFK